MKNRVKCIPWIAHEEAMWLKDRTIRRLTRSTVIMGVICVASNVAWMLRHFEKG